MAGGRLAALIGCLLVPLYGAPALAQEQIVAARIWPARDYTRVTFESRQPLKYELFTVKQPQRLVLDILDVDMGPTLAELRGKVTEGDPYIKGLRAGRNRPGVVRIVLDLKTEVEAQAFTLAPIGDYGHRLVLDIHPLVPPDPLAALLESGDNLVPLEDDAPHVAGSAKRARKQGRLATIVIDAGHGGEDPGARGRRGSYEKNVTLIIAKRLKALVDAEPGMRALLTRDGDYFLPLKLRVEKARAVHADLFVSIHADSFMRPHARGSSVFALSTRRASSEAAWLARKENASDLIGGVELRAKDRYLKQTLIDLSQTGTIDYSLKLGRAVLTQLGQVNTLHKPRVQQAGFAVLTAPDVPSILVETAFISNPQEEKKLNDRGYQGRLARAILSGIKRYVEQNPPGPQPRLAALQ
jgi:N-acetylmuramoyl-L-alanine amidase